MSQNTAYVHKGGDADLGAVTCASLAADTLTFPAQTVTDLECDDLTCDSIDCAGAAACTELTCTSIVGGSGAVGCGNITSVGNVKCVQFGCNGKNPQAAVQVAAALAAPSAAYVEAEIIALTNMVNSLRALLIANGIAAITP